MSFYHHLPSDSAKERFPHNSAAQFSIPIDDAQQLTGEWEVGVAQLVYSNCLYMFNGETIEIGKPRTKAYECDTGCRIDIPRWPKNDRKTAITFIVKFLNKHLKKVMKITFINGNHNSLRLKIEKGWVVCFSDLLRNRLGFFTNAFSDHDNYDHNYNTHHTKPITYYDENYFHVYAVPTNSKTLVKHIVLKEKNSDMTVETLVKKFNYHLQLNGEQVAVLKALETGHLIIEKMKDDDLVLVCSADFHTFLKHRFAALHLKVIARYFAHDYSNQFSKEWSISLYRKNSAPVGGHSFKTSVLSPHIIKSQREAVSYLNQHVDDPYIHFSLRKSSLFLRVTGSNIVLHMDNTVRDILGFDQNTFKSGDDVKASDGMSLTRRINYFQIYSNITTNARVGDTEAPLLAMIPFNPKECSILSERTFKKLHYLGIKSNYIPQIDISIYDDAGALVPFHKDAVTSITLHFRRKS